MKLCCAVPCHNGGTCSVVSNDDYECHCPAGFVGKNCEVPGCATKPCQNGGTCFDFVNDYKCYCHPGFVGRNCEQTVDECRANDVPRHIDDEEEDDDEGSGAFGFGVQVFSEFQKYLPQWRNLPRD